MDRVLHRGSPEEAGMAPERVGRLGRLCAGWVEEGRMPALQVLVARRGVIILDDGWGRARPEGDAPAVTVDTVFSVGSLTKPILATAVMTLVEDGVLSLNHPVQAYLPEFVGEGKQWVLVHHLLTHTSGLRDDDLDVYVAAGLREGRIPPLEPLPHVNDDGFLCLRAFDSLYDAPLSKAPSAEMSYCNYGYRLLAEIVTRVVGQPVDQYVQHRILDPLGMTSTSFQHLPSERLGRHAHGAADAPWPVVRRPDVVATFALGPGSVCANARDMATFAQVFLNDGVHGGTRILSRASVRAMTRNQIPGISSTWDDEHFPEASWGYGWGVRGLKKARGSDSLLSAVAIEHGGIDMHLMWADPTYDLIGLYLSVLPPGVSTERNAAWCADLFTNAAVAAIVD